VTDTTRLFLLLLLLSQLGLGVIHGQGGTIVGVVRTDPDRQAAPDARLHLLGTTLSAMSGPDGFYRIVGVPSGERRVFVVGKGYVPRTLSVIVTAGDSITLDIEVARAARGGTDQAALLTGDHEWITLGADVTRLDAESLARAAPAQTFSELLLARAAGVVVMPSSGTVGTGSLITMRGVANPYLSIAPLVYVDGVRVDPTMQALTVYVGGQAPSRLDDFDPATLQSVAILRGPAAAAIYGAEAANGVILMTTRQGSSGPVRFRAFTGQGLASEAVRFPDNVRAVTATGVACPLDDQAEGRCHVQTILRSNPLENGPASPIAAGAVRAYGLEAVGTVRKVRFALGADLRRDAGIYRLPDAEASRLSSTYGPGTLRDDVLDPNYLRRTSLYSTATFTPSARLEVVAAARYVASSLRLPLNDDTQWGLLTNGLLGSPDSTSGGQWLDSRPGEIFQVGSTQSIDRFSGSANVRFRPTAFLELRGVLGGETLRQHDAQLQRAGEGPTVNGLCSGFVVDNWATTKRLNATISVAAAWRSGGKFTGRTTLGVEHSGRWGDTLLQLGVSLPPGGTSVSQAETLTVGRASDHLSNSGYLLEQTLSVSGRLFLGAALRWDHAAGGMSSPAAVLDPAAWVSWLVPLKGGGALEMLRLRAATGSVARRTPFPLPVPVGPIGGGAPPPSPRAPDPERTVEIEMGADAALFRGRLGIGATVYSRVTRRFVTFVFTPPSSGFAYQVINGGEIWNQGVEVDLVGQLLRTQDATLSVRLGAWGNRNRAARVTTFLPPVGFDQWVFWGYPVGTYLASSVRSLGDLNGDGVITRQELTVGEPMASGSPRPTQGAAASVALAWRRWLHVSTTLEYRGGDSHLNLTSENRCQLVVCSARSVRGTPLAEQARAVAESHGIAVEPEDAGFVKLREVSLTMTAPAPWAARIGASALRLTLAGRNLATWTPYRGLDPEVNATGQLGVSRIDSFTQPLVRTWMARLEVEF
jgi:TonB-dependent SusC/RagA subfamily outer membrane receptor